jgi:hypothetical protein
MEGASMTHDPESMLPEDDAYSRSILLGTNRVMRAGRQVVLRMPSGPRCKLCASPFSSIGGVAMRAMGKGPWPNNPSIGSLCWKDMPIGAGAHTGIAYVGTVGDGPKTDFTVKGHAVNVTARLASAAWARELLVSEPAVAASGLDDSTLEHRRLDLKGKTGLVAVAVINVPVAAQ